MASQGSRAAPFAPVFPGVAKPQFIFFQVAMKTLLFWEGFGVNSGAGTRSGNG